jgi:hypothetical protein
MERFEIRPSRRKGILTALSAFAVAVLGALLQAAPHPSPPVDWLMILGGTAVCVSSILSLRNTEPRFVLDDHGVWIAEDDIGLIPWSEISFARGEVVDNYNSVPRLYIELRDPEQALVRHTSLAGKLSGKELVLIVRGLELDVDDVADAIMRGRSGLSFVMPPGTT